MENLTKEEKYEKLYETLSNYEKQIHAQNQRRIKMGLKCLLIIPTGFLALLFLTNSNKIIFLIMWIISLFGIAFYLIGVEYVDYQLQLKLMEWGEEEKEGVENLIGIDLNDVGDNLKQAIRELEPSAAFREKIDTIRELEPKAMIREKLDKYRESLGIGTNDEPDDTTEDEKAGKKI